MNLSERELKRRLIKKRKLVRQKLDILKHGEIVREQMFSPITKHLKDIGSTLSNTMRQISPHMSSKQVESQNNYMSSNNNLTSLPSTSFKRKTDRKIFEETPVKTTPPPKMPRMISEQLMTPQGQISLNQNENDDNDLSDLKMSILENINSDDDDNSPFFVSKESPSRFKDLVQQSFLSYLDQYDPLPRKYIQDMYSDDDNKEFDHKYGIRLDTDIEALMIGDSRVNIDGNDILVKNRRYRGTQGLYELLFKKDPKHFTEEDITNYRNIVKKTNAHRRHYKSNGQVDGSKLKKYKKIIAPLVIGKGVFMQASDNKIDYTHWNDVNELIDRLRLLLSSVSAGHTGHINEINSIIEELREARIIE